MIVIVVLCSRVLLLTVLVDDLAAEAVVALGPWRQIGVESVIGLLRGHVL